MTKLEAPVKTNPRKWIVFTLMIAALGPFLRSQTTAISNLGQTFGGSAQVGQNTIEQACSFTTGATPYSLSSVSLKFYSESSATGFKLELFAGVSNTGPSGFITAFNGSSSPVNESVYTPAFSTTLAANTTYWLVASAPSTSDSFGWFMTASPFEDAGGLSGWSIGDGRWVTGDALSWHATGDYPAQFSVEVAAIPEPATYAALMGATLLGTALYRRSRRQLTSRPAFQDGSSQRPSD